MRWFLIQSIAFIALSFGLGLVVGYLWWVRRLRRVSEAGVAQSTPYRALVSQHAREAAEQAEELTLLRAERDRLAESLAARSAERDREAAAAEQHQAELDAARAERSTRDETLRRETERALAELRGQLAGARKERDSFRVAAERLKGAEAAAAQERDDAQAALEHAQRETAELRRSLRQQAAAPPTRPAAVAASVIDLRGPDPAPSPAAAANGAGGPAGERPERPERPDDLRRIEGIGPKIAAALNKAGVTTFAQLAAASEEELRNALSASELSFAPSLLTWAEQAGYLARGDEAGFAALTEKLTAGRLAGAAKRAKGRRP